MVLVRRSAPKSRNGCQTCKIRRVKCDETHPRCQRCISTGRVCDGYSSGDGGSPERVNDAVIPHPSRPPSQKSPGYDIQERRSFEFFRAETVPSIAGFFGAGTWKLVLQACDQEPAVNQAVIALGALYERASVAHSLNNTDIIPTGVPIESNFAQQQYCKALQELRRYLSSNKELDMNIILICALIHISIEVTQKNYLNALVHLENSLRLLQESLEKAKRTTSPESGQQSILSTADVDINLSRTFINLDLHASTYQGMRQPAMADFHNGVDIPGRFSSLDQAKLYLDALTGQLYWMMRGISEDYKYRRMEVIPQETHRAVERLVESFDNWNVRFEKYLNRPTSKFSRQEQTIINVLITNHRIYKIEAATCTKSAATIYDSFDAEFDEVVTLSAVIINERKNVNTRVQKLSLDIGVILPLYFTAVNCREPWIRQRAMSLLRTIDFQEGVWNAVTMVSVASVVIAKEQEYIDAGLEIDGRPLEVARIHSVGTDIDASKRTSEVVMSWKLDGLDGPYTYVEEYVSW
ncbi:hypothetical protein F5884DRAFT_867453 [Xylogone sp. PMI_703]|nr:hypothetical protein F5884DRAFT_867453 [Xylogone sp. PMI_703]